MVSNRRSTKQLGGNEQLVDVLQATSISDLLEDFHLYNQHLQEECYLVFSQLQASGEFLSSPHISAYMEEFGDNSFERVKTTYDTLMSDLMADEFVRETLFTDQTNGNVNENANENAIANTNVVTGGARSIDIDLSNITPETVKSYSLNALASVIKRYGPQHDELTSQQQENLALCITEHQVRSMTSQNKLYLGDISVSCMLYNQFKNIAIAAHKDITEMSIPKKMNIMQNLFADALKWGGKQIMLRLRAPEFDVSAVSDMASFKEEILKFVGNRISQIMNKSQSFRGASSTIETQKEHLKWVLTIIENIDSLLSFVKTISQLSMLSASPDFNFNVNVRASMSTGVKVNIKTNEWLEEIGQSVNGLKEIVENKKDTLTSILDINIYNTIREGEASRKAKEVERQLNLLNINIQAKETILAKQPNNNIIFAELGRLTKLRDKLLQDRIDKKEEIEYTCIQLLQEIHMLVTSMEIPHVPLNVISKKIIQEIATKVDHSAFSSVVQSVSGNVASQVSKIDVGFRSYFGCIGKYLDVVPNISNLYNHIGFTLPDLHGVIEKLGTISGFIGDIAAHSGAYIQVVNVCLLIVHLIVAASLNCRNKTLNKERVTLDDMKKQVSLDDIKSASKDRMSAFSSVSSSVTSLPKIGVRGGKLKKTSKTSKTSKRRMNGGNRFPSLRRSIVEPNHEMPFFVQGRKAMLNERIKQHSITLLAPKYTKEMLLNTIFSQPMSDPTQQDEHIENVDIYMYANEKSLENNRSVLENLKVQLPQLRSVMMNPSSCSAMPSQLSSQEDIYLLSIFSAYQGQQLRNAFKFSTLSQKPSQDSLYCKVTQRINLDDPRLQKVVASIVTSFNGDTMIGGSKHTKKRSQAIQSFLDKKTKEELYAYASSKALQVKPSMSKQNLIQVIYNMK
jgi:hypothetical protein